MRCLAGKLQARRLEQRYLGSLSSSLMWMLVGSFSKGMSQWGLLILLARWSGPETVGEYGLAQAIALPLMTFANLQLIRLQGTDFSGRYLFSDYFSVRVVSTALVAFVLTFLLWFLDFDTSMVILVIMVALRLTIESFAELFYGLFVKYQNVSLQGQGMTYSSWLSFVAIGSLLHAGRSLALALLAGTVATALTILVFHARKARALSREERLFEDGWLKSRSYRGLLREAVPLGLVLLLVSLTANVPRYLLEHYQGTFTLGIFVALLTLLSAGTLITDAIGQLLTPFLSRSSQSKASTTRALRRVFPFACAASLIALVLSFSFGPIIVNVVFGDVYAEATPVIVVVALIWVVQMFSRFVDIVVVSVRRLRTNLIGSILSLAVTTSLCVVLIPACSLMGAAVAMLIGATVRFFTLLFVVRNHRYQYS